MSNTIEETKEARALENAYYNARRPLEQIYRAAMQLEVNKEMQSDFNINSNEILEDQQNLESELKRAKYYFKLELERIIKNL